MFKKILAFVLTLFAAAAFAAVDVNKADQAQLETIKGIGPAIAGKILDERKKGEYKDWSDLIDRVKGVGEGNAAKFSAEGLTVNGGSFSGAPATAKKEAKPKKSKADKAAAAETAPAAASESASASGKKKSKKDKKAAATEAQ
jgi:competence protein ComEA